MNEINQTVTEADLHAFADGQLPEQARARIEAWLTDNPGDAARVAEWSAQNAEIRSLFADYEKSTDADIALVTGRTRPANWPKRLAAVRMPKATSSR